jgi:hypothetical protein
MTSRGLLVFVFMSLSVTAQASDPGAHDERYLCVQEMATGFGFDEKLNKWTNAVFHPTENYMVTTSSSSGRTYQISKTGLKVPVGYCEKGFTDHGSLFCDMDFGQVMFNKSTGRFLVSYMAGYYDTGPGGRFTDGLGLGSDTPFIAIGKCSPF